LAINRIDMELIKSAIRLTAISTSGFSDSRVYPSLHRLSQAPDITKPTLLRRWAGLSRAP